MGNQHLGQCIFVAASVCANLHQQHVVVSVHRFHLANTHTRTCLQCYWGTRYKSRETYISSYSSETLQIHFLRFDEGLSKGNPEGFPCYVKTSCTSTYRSYCDPNSRASLGRGTRITSRFAVQRADSNRFHTFLVS